jgi:zinc protease
MAEFQHVCKIASFAIKSATAISVSYDPYNRGDSLFMISAIPSDGVSLPDAQKAIEKEMNLFKTELSIKQN